MKTTLVALLLFYSGISFADYAQAEAQATKAASCSWLMTEAECQQHREAMATMKDPIARATYLEWYADMLHEREVMCGCSGKRHLLARAYYR